MSFMYESMVSRAPGKRKIKVQEENLLRLMQEEEDDDEEDDDDFEVSKEQFNELTNESDDTLDSDESSSDSSKDSSSSSNCNAVSAPSNKPAVTRSRKHHSYNRQQFFSPTIQATNHQILSSKKEANSEILAKARKQFQISTEWIKKKDISASKLNVCWICLKKKDLNEMVTCKICGVTVHKDCYGIVENARRTSTNNDEWLCSRCISDRVQGCEFCPSLDGCIKETTNGQWCHVICARYILGKDMYRGGVDGNLIGVTSLNYKRYGLHECSLCEDRTVSKTGISVKCDAGLCKSFFHVTCAQKYGLLSDNETNLNRDTDPHFVYCPLHIEKEKMAASQKLYLTAVAVQKHLIQSGQSHDEAALRKERSSYVAAQNTRFPNPPSTGEPPSRLLSSSPAAMRMLTKKSELMFDVNVRTPALYFPKPSDVRKRHHVTPALTCEFASHFADRQLRIVETKERIENLMKENEAMMEKQKELERKYEALQSNLSTSESQQQNVLEEVNNLRRLYVRLKMWADENKLVATKKTKFSSMKPDMKEKRFQAKRKSPDNASGTRLKVSKANPNAVTSSSGLLRRCSVCKSGKRPHLLINCDVCDRWLHLACVDPPLTHMPRKSKFSMWQCSECAPSSDSSSGEEASLHGSLITSEGRRQTRRSHKPPVKLASSMLCLPRRIKRRNQTAEQIRALVKKRRIEQKKNLKPVETSKQVILRPRISVNITRKVKRRKENLTKSFVDKEKQMSKPLVMVTRDVHLDKAIESSMHPPQKADSPPVSPPNSNFSPLLFPYRPLKPKSLTPVQAKTGNGSFLPRQVNLPPGVQIAFSPPHTTSAGPTYALIPTASVVPQQISMVNSEIFRSILTSCVTSWPKTKIPTPGNLVSLKPEIPLFSTSSTSKAFPIPSVSATFPSSLASNTPTMSVKSENLPVASCSQIATSFSNTNIDHPYSKDTESAQLLKVTEIEEIKEEKSIPTEQSNKVIPPPVCTVCDVSSDVDKMMLCDVCNKHYHIWCCSPPLVTRPRKSKFFTWECSSCYQSSDNSDSLTISAGSETTSDGRRKITRTRKPPEKFANIFSTSEQRRLMRAVLCRRKSGKKRFASPSSLKPAKFATPRKKSTGELPLRRSLTSDDAITKDVGELLEKLATLTHDSVASEPPFHVLTKPTGRDDVVMTSASAVDVSKVQDEIECQWSEPASSSAGSCCTSRTVLPVATASPPAVAPSRDVISPEVVNVDTYTRESDI